MITREYSNLGQLAEPSATDKDIAVAKTFYATPGYIDRNVRSAYGVKEGVAIASVTSATTADITQRRTVVKKSWFAKNHKYVAVAAIALLAYTYWGK